MKTLTGRYELTCAGCIPQTAGGGELLDCSKCINILLCEDCNFFIVRSYETSSSGCWSSIHRRLFFAFFQQIDFFFRRNSTFNVHLCWIITCFLCCRIVIHVENTFSANLRRKRRSKSFVAYTKYSCCCRMDTVVVVMMMRLVGLVPNVLLF